MSVAFRLSQTTEERETSGKDTSSSRPWLTPPSEKRIQNRKKRSDKGHKKGPIWPFPLKKQKMEDEIVLPQRKVSFKLTFSEKIQIGKWIDDQEHKTIDQVSEASLTSLCQQIEALMTKSDQELSVSHRKN